MVANSSFLLAPSRLVNLLRSNWSTVKAAQVIQVTKSVKLKERGGGTSDGADKGRKHDRRIGTLTAVATIERSNRKNFIIFWRRNAMFGCVLAVVVTEA